MRIRHFCYSTLWGLLFIVRFAYAQEEPVAAATLNVARVETGDTFLLRLTVTRNEARPDSVDFRAWQKMLPRENIIRQTAWSKAASQRWERTYVFIAFDSAFLQLPGLTVWLPSGKKIVSNTLRLNVTPTESGESVANMEPPRDIVREATYWYDYWPYGVGALLLLAALVGIWRRMRRRRPAPPKPLTSAPTVPPPPTEPAHLWALRQLEQLDQKTLWQKGQIEPYYRELSWLIRAYVQRRFGIGALEATTEEIIQALRAQSLPDQALQTLRELLQNADLSKFARMHPSKDFHVRALRQAQQFVQNTAPNTVPA